MFKNCRRKKNEKKRWDLINPDELPKKKSAQLFKKISKGDASLGIISRPLFLSIHRRFFYSLHACDDFSDFEDTFRYSYNPPEKKIECLCELSNPCPVCEILKIPINSFEDILILKG